MTLSDIGARIAAAFRPLASVMALRSVTTINTRAAVAAPAGATAMTLTGASLVAGDTFAAGGPGLRSVTGFTALDADATMVTFAPALTSPIAAGSTVAVQRATDRQLCGWEESVDLARAGGLLTAADRLVVVIAEGDRPEPGQRLVIGGETLTVQSVSGDGTGAAWRLVVRR